MIPNGYPAWGSIPTLISALLKLPQRYHRSVGEGKTTLDALISGRLANCPDAKLVLTGYSQGAQVTGDVYQNVSSKRIIGVVLFGDPKFNSADSAGRGGKPGLDGALGTRPLFSVAPGKLSVGRVLSYCHDKDPVCQGVSRLRYGSTYHKDYGARGEPQAAAKYLSRFVPLRIDGTIRIARTKRQKAKLAGMSLGIGTRAAVVFNRFGKPSSCRLNGGPYDVIASWRMLGVTIWTTTLGLAGDGFRDGCTTSWGTFVSQVALRGRRWQTEEGLRAGETLEKMLRLYPRALSQPAYARSLSVAAAYSIIDESCRYGDPANVCPVVIAAVESGRVASLIIEVGGQGD